MDLPKLETLLNPCPEAPPSGPSLDYQDDFIELFWLRNGQAEVIYGEMKIDAAPPDWADLASRAIALFRQSHDLRLAMLLTEAWLALDGLEGLAHGLQLINRLIREEWPSLHPQLDASDGDDPLERCNALSPLGKKDGFLLQVGKHILYTSAQLGPVALQTLANIQDNNSTSAYMEDIIRCCANDGMPQLFASLNQLDHCLSLTGQMEQQLDSLVGTQHNLSLQELRRLLTQAGNFIREYLPDSPAANASDVDAENETFYEAGELNDRRQVAWVLQQVLLYFARHEPSSPVPIFISRSLRLMNMNFVEIICDMAPSGLGEIQLLHGPIDNPQSAQQDAPSGQHNREREQDTQPYGQHSPFQDDEPDDEY